MKPSASRTVVQPSSSATPADVTDVRSRDRLLTPSLSDVSSLPNPPRKLVRRTQFGSKRIPKKFQRSLPHSSRMSEDEPVASTMSPLLT